MYECCLHTLRVFLLRLGWVGEAAECTFEPVPGVASRLRCRGQVTAATRTVAYEISIKEIGYGPEPFAIADALMYADGKAIVDVRDITLRLTGATKQQLESWWNAPSGAMPTALHGHGFSNSPCPRKAVGMAPVLRPQTLLSSGSPTTLGTDRAGFAADRSHLWHKPTRSTSPADGPDRECRQNRPGAVEGDRRPSRSAGRGGTKYPAAGSRTHSEACVQRPQAR
jgi:hypothetical protein